MYFILFKLITKAIKPNGINGSRKNKPAVKW